MRTLKAMHRKLIDIYANLSLKLFDTFFIIKLFRNFLIEKGIAKHSSVFNNKIFSTKTKYPVFCYKIYTISSKAVGQQTFQKFKNAYHSLLSKSLYIFSISTIYI